MKKNELAQLFDCIQVRMGHQLCDQTFQVAWDSEVNTKLKFHNQDSVGKLSVDVTTLHLTLYFYNRETLYKAQLPIDAIRGKVKVVHRRNRISLTLVSLRNQLLYVCDEAKLFHPVANPWVIKKWTRAISLHLDPQKPAPLMASKLSSHGRTFRDENCSVWRLDLPQPTIENHNLNHNLMEKIQLLINYNLAQFEPAESLLPTVKQLPPAHLTSTLNFSRHYLLECLLTNNLLSTNSVTELFLNLFQKICSETLSQIVERIWAKNEFISNPYHYFLSELTSITFPVQHINPHTHCLIHKIVITPTKVYVLPPKLEESNQVLRHYFNNSNQFLRVTFCDENYNSIPTNYDMSHQLIKRISNIFFFGINLARQKYRFLAFSASQLKDHSCWFFSDGNGLNSDIIRDWMGDFSEIHVAAKYAARMGQCFSSSRVGAKLELGGFSIIEDIQQGGQCFTDGVGLIEWDVMCNISQILQLYYVPSAIQFRMAGFKGVLSVWLNLGPNKIQLRPSQLKFQSTHFNLEVLRCSYYHPAHLNRQIITLLSALGVPDTKFLILQSEMLLPFTTMHRCHLAAQQVLSQNVDEFGTAQVLIELIRAGFFSTSDAYVASCLELYYNYSIKELRNRAKIHVQKGAKLLGVADETKSLLPNEIFAQISDPLIPGHWRVITGLVLVARNPCFHPGDIRVVHAVDNIKLRHLSDVIVFSVQGERSVPSMCSGGDLDGDDFTVIWDQRLIPTNQTVEPMTELPARADYLRQVKVADITKFFVNYVTNDNLGKIANAHLAKADNSPSGAFDPVCLRLAQLHSRAVDFTKTGIKAEFNKEDQPQLYPDFMNKPPSQSYISNKILGTLFRSLEYTPTTHGRPSKLDHSMKTTGYLRYLEEAALIKLEYNAGVRSLMAQYGINSELELVTGCVLSHRESVCKRSYEVCRTVSQSMLAIRTKYITRFYGEGLNDDKLSSNTRLSSKELRAKAYAWYHSVYSSSVEATISDVPMVSFAWLAYKHLIEIKLAQTLRNIDTKEPFYLPDSDTAPNSSYPTATNIPTFANFDSSDIDSMGRLTYLFQNM